MTDSPNYISKPKRRQLDRFIIQLMEPAAPGDLVDRKYNSIMRRTREAAWQKADFITRYYSALRSMSHILSCGIPPKSVVSGISIPPLDDCVAMYRSALVDQLLTPAPQKTDVAWKKRQNIRYLPVDSEQVARAIKEDEEFLAAHPVTARKYKPADNGGKLSDAS
ncbi:hypothetical protein [Rhizobium rhizogenes]|uniref:hypothetical protein n=1 Tax=Rhizobium rhizogenes TaxID=359 RepID=UPI00226EC6D6|nr:hypothetical protein [Rhizobium rhizogenes]